MATPYISVAMLNAASTGIAWNLIPDIESDDAAKAAEQTNILSRATSRVDTYCNQPLRSVVSNEPLSGPGMPRFGWLPETDVPQLVMRRWPITEVLAVQLSPMRQFPRVWSPLKPTDYEIEFPMMDLYSYPGSPTAPDGGSSILLKPGTVERCRRRGTLRALVSYTNGWPHAGLTASAEAGDTVLQIDDVTGWAGAAGFAYDGSATEDLTVLTVEANTPIELPNGVGLAQTGPGQVTLAAPLAFDHEPGVLVSALPASAQLATIYACVLQALESGVDAITAETLPGSETVAGHGMDWIKTEFEKELGPFRRIV